MRAQALPVVHLALTILSVGVLLVLAASAARQWIPERVVAPQYATELLLLGAGAVFPALVALAVLEVDAALWALRYPRARAWSFVPRWTPKTGH